MFGRQPRGVLRPTSRPEMAPAMKPTTIQPMTFISSMREVSHGVDDGIGMRVVGGVARAIDDRDATVRQPRIEGEGRRAKDGDALAAEQLEDGLADEPEPLQRRGWVRLGLELAQDRSSGQIGSAR
jgi:hypothetical protein